MNITIPPNKPTYLALTDPAGDSANYDFDLHLGRYQTTDGRTLQIPRPAVLKLNELSPRPGEEIQIVKIWSGKASDQPEWSFCLSTRSENARAREESEAQDLTGVLQASIEQANAGKSAVAPPTPIRTPKKEPMPAEQPRLFDRGTGTHGPVPRPLIPDVKPAYIPVRAVASQRQPPDKIPANIAVKEILQFIALDQNTKNWSDQARQDLASTIIIAAYKAGQVGLWERGQ